MRLPASGVAAWYFDTTLTAGAGRPDSDALAAALAELGVAAGDRVAVELQNMPQLLVCLAAAWKAGAAACR